MTKQIGKITNLRERMNLAQKSNSEEIMSTSKDLVSKELKGIKINASIITSLVENANVTSLFQLVDTPVDNLVTNCGFTEQNAAKLLKQAKDLKRYGDGQIDKWVKSETKLKKKVEKVKGRVYTPYSLAPTFSFYDKKAEHCLVFGNYETKGLNLDGVLRKSHTDTERGKVYRK